HRTRTRRAARGLPVGAGCARACPHPPGPRVILPGGTLGVLGGGQLGRRFTAEARRMGYRVVVVEPTPDAPAAQLADRHLNRPWSDPDALAEVAATCDAVTTEFENVPADALRALAAHVPVHPSGDAVAVTQ